MAGKMRRGPDPAPSFPRMSKPCKECKEIHNQPRFISVKVPLFLPGFQQKRCPQVSPVMRDLPRPFYRAVPEGESDQSVNRKVHPYKIDIASYRRQELIAGYYNDDITYHWRQQSKQKKGNMITYRLS